VAGRKILEMAVARAPGPIETSQAVLKDFPSESEVKPVLAGVAKDFCWTELPYYWFLTYKLG
jgi:hypothetical protein